MNLRQKEACYISYAISPNESLCLVPQSLYICSASLISEINERPIRDQHPRQ